MNFTVKSHPIVLILVSLMSFDSAFGYIRQFHDYSRVPNSQEAHQSPFGQDYSQEMITESARPTGGLQRSQFFLTNFNGQDFVIVRNPFTGEVTVLPSSYLMSLMINQNQQTTTIAATSTSTTTNSPGDITSTTLSGSGQSTTQNPQRNVQCSSYMGNCRRFFYPSSQGM